MENYGLLTIVSGIVDEEGILENLRTYFQKDWNWQLKKLGEASYIIKFPPQKRVENLVVGTASLFYLNKGKAMASLKAWNGDIELVGMLEEVWVQITGIPPKWVDWWSIKDVVSSIGILLEVDWLALFASFFATARVRERCKNARRIPKERVFEMDGGCYVIQFKPEGVLQLSEKSEEEDDNDDDGGSDDDLLDDEIKEKDKRNVDHLKMGRRRNLERKISFLLRMQVVQCDQLEQEGVSLLKGSWILRLLSYKLKWRSLTV